MGAAIGMRNDFDAASLRRLARVTKSANQGRRLLALAEIYDGGSRSDAARIGGVTLQIVRDWVVRFNDRGPDGLLNGKAPGKPPLLSDAQRQALAEIVESGPIPAIHGVVRWRLIDLTRWLHDEFGVSLTETTVGRELKKLGYVKLTARPRHHAQNEYAMEDFKRGLCSRAGKDQGRPSARHGDRGLVSGRSPDRPEKQDHPPLGQARHAALGTQGPTNEIGLHLRCHLPRTWQGRWPGSPILQYPDHVAASGGDIACYRAGRHGVLLMDQAGWHMTGKLEVPDNISIVPLPPKCPELNPVENIWQFMRDNWLSNRIFTSHDNIIDLCCEAWNRLVDQPWRIMTIGRRKWARGS